MKKILLFTRRNVGLISLSYLIARGHKVYVISDDADVLWLALSLGAIARPHIKYVKDFGDFDMVLSVHWNKVIPVEYFNGKPAVNVHPLLTWYKGKNPVSRYIENKNTSASVESHYMTDVVDEGEVICREFFETEVIDSYASFYNIALPYYFRIIERTLKIVL